MNNVMLNGFFAKVATPTRDARKGSEMQERGSGP